MRVEVFEEGMTNCYVAYHESSKEGFCVDVSDCMSEDYFTFIKKNALKIRYLLLTHGHYDHCNEIRLFKHHFPQAKVVISRADYENIERSLPVFCAKEAFLTPDILCEDGQCLPFGDETIQVIATPGHTSGSVCYLLKEHLFCGDTIFDGSVGRTDLPTGSFMQLMQSVQKIAALPDCTLYPGHMNITTLAQQRKFNRFFK